MRHGTASLRAENRQLKDRLLVDDPKIPMDNNASERTVRGPAMGRKNYFGSGSLWSVCLTAAMFSIVATWKQWKINPRRSSWGEKRWPQDEKSAQNVRRSSDKEPVGS